MKEIFSKISGVTFNNRQENVKLLKIGDILEFKKEVNPYHSKSIKLYKDRKEVGFIKRYDHYGKPFSDKIYDIIQKVEVKNITQKNGTYGVNIKITTS